VVVEVVRHPYLVYSAKVIILMICATGFLLWERKQSLSQQKRCFVSLKTGHMMKECPSANIVIMVSGDSIIDACVLIDSWDEILSEDLVKEWNEIAQNICEASSLKLDRFMGRVSRKFSQLLVMHLALAPWQGGCYKRLVALVKQTIGKVLVLSYGFGTKLLTLL